MDRLGPAGVRPEGTPPTSGIGLDAARRALRSPAPTASPRWTGPPYVAAFTPVANIAVGDETPWGVAAELDRLLPGTATGVRPRRPPTSADLLAAAGERTVVAVVRDEHRHPWMAQALARPGGRPARTRSWSRWACPRPRRRGALHIATHGAARVCGEAAAEVIAGREA